MLIDNTLIRDIPEVPAAHQLQILQNCRFGIEREVEALAWSERIGLKVYFPAMQIAVYIYTGQGHLFQIEVITAVHNRLPTFSHLQLPRKC